MVGYELTRTIGEASATYKFTPKYVLKAGLKVTVRLHAMYKAQYCVTIVFSHFAQMFFPNTWPWPCLSCGHPMPG